MDLENKVYKQVKRVRRDLRQLLVFGLLFLLFNWKIVVALTAVTESIQERVDYIDGLHLSWVNFLVPLILSIGLQLLDFKSLLSSHKKETQNAKTHALEQGQRKDLICNVYSDIGLAGKSLIDETLIYSTAQENFLKKNSLSVEEVNWVREDLCLKYQDSLKKIQELMIVLYLQNQEKMIEMQQRLKSEKRI